MASQSNLVWNVRYLTPALPLVYVVLASRLPWLQRSAKPISAQSPIDVLAYGLVALMSLESLLNFPHYFSYINPLVGGAHRTPIALNDSNFDYGQDLFEVRPWLERSAKNFKSGSSLKVFGLLSGLGRPWLSDIVTPANHEVIASALQRQISLNASPPSRPAEPSCVLIVSRGLAHPERWALECSTIEDESLSSDTVALIDQLLSYPPDEFITPVMAAYYLSDRPAD